MKKKRDICEQVRNSSDQIAMSEETPKLFTNKPKKKAIIAQLNHVEANLNSTVPPSSAQSPAAAAAASYMGGSAPPPPPPPPPTRSNVRFLPLRAERSENHEKMTTFSDLPEELQTDILSRVPAKSLAKLKTTCKRWYALFRDPSFVEKKFGKSASEVILLMSSGIYPINLGLDSIQNQIVPSTELTGKLITVLDDDSNLEITEIFHCSGLVLCAARNNSRLVVWNPCTGETRLIKPRKSYRSDDFFALGYKNDDSSSCHSYRILRFCRYYDSEKRLVFKTDMYDFSSDSWRVLKTDDDDTGNCCIDECKGVTMKGNGYWFATDEDDPMGKFILKFDFTTERFERLCLPQYFHDEVYVDEMVTLSVVGEDQKLALLQQSVDCMELYMMKLWKLDDDAKEVSWIHLLSAGLGDFKLPSVTSFLWDEENQLVVCCDTDMEDVDKTRIYIVGEYIYETIYKDTTTTGSRRNWPILLTYVPNLVRIHKDSPKRLRKRKLANSILQAPWEGRLRKRH